MGKKLLEYYKIVGQAGGLQYKMRLAMKTGIPSTDAAQQPDSPELVKRFQAAAEEIVGTSVPLM